MGMIMDADVIIRAERGAFDLVRWIKTRTDEPQIAAITAAELWHGVERATALHRHYRERYIRAFLDSVGILPYTEMTAILHARIWAVLESLGKMAGPYDLIVAATALEHGSSVVTFNRRHFAQIQGLSVVVPE